MKTLHTSIEDLKRDVKAKKYEIDSIVKKWQTTEENNRKVIIELNNSTIINRDLREDILEKNCSPPVTGLNNNKFYVTSDNSNQNFNKTTSFKENNDKHLNDERNIYQGNTSSNFQFKKENFDDKNTLPKLKNNMSERTVSDIQNNQNIQNKTISITEFQEFKKVNILILILFKIYYEKLKIYYKKEMFRNYQ